MHKDQYTDAPSQEQVRVKTMLNSTISMGYPDVVIAEPPRVSWRVFYL
ncbi:TPA: hypothetical protein LGK41_004621 [Escherichia coli]|nr:hypothetical protein [Escherichia coli]